MDHRQRLAMIDPHLRLSMVLERFMIEIEYPKVSKTTPA
jgi:hypothetical protein